MSLLTYPKFQAPTLDGVNLSGGKVYFYEAGTAILKGTYSDKALATPNTNPVILDARGEADIYLSGIYKIILKDANDVEVWTEDNYIQDYPIIVSTIADLRLTNGGDTVLVKGYYADGDGGGGDFYWDSTSTETDNGGTIIKATAITTGRWKRLFSGEINVRWFGATGDNSTDDTTTIQSAIDASSSQVLFFPTGNYVTTAALNSTDQKITIKMPQGALIKSSVAAGTFAFDIINNEYSDIELRIESDGNGINVKQDSGTGAGNSYNNKITGRVKNIPGRTAAKPALNSGTVAVRFGAPAIGKTNYFNRADMMEIDRFDTCFDLPKWSNGNFITDPVCSSYWRALHISSNDNSVRGGFYTNANGIDASNLTEVIHLGNGTDVCERNNILTQGEPGNFAQMYFIEALASDNLLLITTNTGGVANTNNNIDNNTTINEDEIVTRTLNIRSNFLAPAQPSFQATLSTNQSNFAVGSEQDIQFDTETFDQAAEFNTTTYTHTASQSGKYQYNIMVRLLNVDSAATRYYVQLTTGNRNYHNIITTNQFAGDLPYLTFPIAVLADMDINDTAKVVVYQDIGTAQTDVATGASYFSGFQAH